MKKILFFVVMLALLGVSTCLADNTSTTTTTPTSVAADVINTVNPQVGIMYAVREHQVKEVNSVQVISWQSQKYAAVKGNLNVLYAPTDMWGLSATYPLGSLSQITGVTIPVPVLNWVTQANLNVGIGGGYLTKGDTRKVDGGPIVSGNIKF